MARLEGLTAAQADDLADEWRQLGATDIRRTPEAGGLFTMECSFPAAAGAPVPAAVAASKPAAMLAASPKPAAGRRPAGSRSAKPR